MNGARTHRKREEEEAGLTWTAMLSLPSALAPISHFTNPPYLHAASLQLHTQKRVLGVQASAGAATAHAGERSEVAGVLLLETLQTCDDLKESGCLKM